MKIKEIIQRGEHACRLPLGALRLQSASHAGMRFRGTMHKNGGERPPKHRLGLDGEERRGAGTTGDEVETFEGAKHLGGRGRRLRIRATHFHKQIAN
jgi:hypothetical protein